MAAILNIAQLKKCSTCPRWHQADFSSVVCTLPEYAKKTSVMSQNEVMCHICYTVTDVVDADGELTTYLQNASNLDALKL